MILIPDSLCSLVGPMEELDILIEVGWQDSGKIPFMLKVAYDTNKWLVKGFIHAHVLLGIRSP